MTETKRSSYKEFNNDVKKVYVLIHQNGQNFKNTHDANCWPVYRASGT